MGFLSCEAFAGSLPPARLADGVHIQFAQQLVACMHFVQMRHDLEKLGPNDKIREPKEQAPKEGA